MSFYVNEHLVDLEDSPHGPDVVSRYQRRPALLEKSVAAKARLLPLCEEFAAAMEVNAAAITGSPEPEVSATTRALVAESAVRDIAAMEHLRNRWRLADWLHAEERGWSPRVIFAQVGPGSGWPAGVI